MPKGVYGLNAMLIGKNWVLNGINWYNVTVKYKKNTSNLKKVIFGIFRCKK